MKKSAAVLLGCVLVAGCGSGSTNEPGGKVVININGQPPQTQAFDRKVFDEDVAEFERQNQDIDLVPHEAKPRPIEVVLSNSFGFGGTNASLVLRAA